MAKWKKDDDKEITLREFKSFVWNEYKYLKKCDRPTATNIAINFGCIRADTYPADNGYISYADEDARILMVLTNRPFPTYRWHDIVNASASDKWYTRAEIDEKATEAYYNCIRGDSDEWCWDMCDEDEDLWHIWHVRLEAGLC